MAYSQQQPGCDVSCSVEEASELGCIFIVEDDDAGREALEAWLNSQQFRTHAFGSAEEFLNDADLEAPGCVITDFRMPGINGTELQAALQQRQCLLPVVIISGYADVVVTVRAMQQGAVTLLEKPYRNDELLKAIGTALLRNVQWRDEERTTRQVRQRMAELSSAQRQTMDLLISGQSNKVIADQLDLGLRTVERHRQQILRTMRVESLPELATLLAGVR